MSDPEFELPKNLTPSGGAVDRAVEEIVSPVQPQKRPSHVRSGLVPFVIVLVCALVGGAFLFDHWPKFEYHIKEAHAPETDSIVVIPTPSVIAALGVVPTPSPQIASISTDEPSAVVMAPTPTATPTPVAVAPTPKPARTAPTPTVAGAAVTKATSTHATTYVAPQGYTITLAKGASASTEGDVTVVYTSRGLISLRVETAALLLETSAALGYQLSLSPDVSNLKAVVWNGYPGYAYEVSGHAALALIKESTVYYLTAYQPGQLNTFRINN